jgi:hypothetical protein
MLSASGQSPLRFAPEVGSRYALRRTGCPRSGIFLVSRFINISPLRG